MKTAQRIFGTLIVAAVVSAGCNRADTDENARRTATEVRDVAVRAGDQLADSWLTTKIQAQYFADQDVKARFINVSSRDGVVTLKGRVDTAPAREQAVQIAKNTDGVRQVSDQLVVGPAPVTAAAAGPVDSAWITTQIQARYFADSVIDGRDIDVTTNDGVVTLSGRVSNELERQEAVGIARGIDGVTRVEDRLTIQELASSGAVSTSGTTARGAGAPAPPVDDSRITSSIQARYFLDNTLKSRRIEVDTKQGVVTLRGDVASDDERAQALLLARTTEGAQRVEDTLTVNAALTQPQPAGAANTQLPASPAAQSQDAALTKSIESKFAADRQVKAGAIEITAKDGVVLIEGNIPSAAAKQQALLLARQTEGVLQVIDRIRVSRTR